eukprot:s575_g40.t1
MRTQGTPPQAAASERNSSGCKSRTSQAAAAAPERKRAVKPKRAPGRTSGAGGNPGDDGGNYDNGSDPSYTYETEEEEEEQREVEPFTGQRRAYKDWKRVLTAQRSRYQLQDKELSLLVCLSYKGDARQILNQLEMDEMTAEGGLQRMLALLEEACGSRPDCAWRSAKNRRACQWRHKAKEVDRVLRFKCAKDSYWQDDGGWRHEEEDDEEDIGTATQARGYNLKALAKLEFEVQTVDRLRKDQCAPAVATKALDYDDDGVKKKPGKEIKLMDLQEVYNMGPSLSPGEVIVEALELVKRKPFASELVHLSSVEGPTCIRASLMERPPVSEFLKWMALHLHALACVGFSEMARWHEELHFSIRTMVVFGEQRPMPLNMTRHPHFAVAGDSASAGRPFFVGYYSRSTAAEAHPGGGPSQMAFLDGGSPDGYQQESEESEGPDASEAAHIASPPQLLVLSSWL